MASVTGRGTPRTSHQAVTRQIANNRNANGRGMATTLSPSRRRSNRHPPRSQPAPPGQPPPFSPRRASRIFMA
jgi:hypothetical protein